MTDWEASEEIAEINAISLEAVQEIYGVDTKEEAIRGIRESVETLAEYDYTEDELEAERDYLCLSQGLSRYC